MNNFITIIDAYFRNYTKLYEQITNFLKWIFLFSELCENIPIPLLEAINDIRLKKR